LITEKIVIIFAKTFQQIINRNPNLILMRNIATNTTKSTIFQTSFLINPNKYAIKAHPKQIKNPLKDSWVIVVLQIPTVSTVSPSKQYFKTIVSGKIKNVNKLIPLKSSNYIPVSPRQM